MADINSANSAETYGRSIRRFPTFPEISSPGELSAVLDDYLEHSGHGGDGDKPLILPLRGKHTFWKLKWATIDNIWRK